MKTIIQYISVLLLLLSLSSCSEELVGKVETGTVKGLVVKQGTNEPLKNVKVHTSPTTETVFTGDDGSFIIENIPLGDYSVRAELNGYITSFQGVNLKTEQQVVTVVFEMSDDNSLNSPPSVPVLISPIDNATDQPLEVDLSWSSTDPDSTDVLKYKVVIKNDFDLNVITVNDLTDTHYYLDSLKFGVTYYWQVEVNDGINPPVNSPVFRFKTSTTPNNRFHYVKKHANGNYYIVSANETNTTFPFTTSNSNSWRPRLNQNAGLIAFLRTVGGNAQIFTAKPDGSQEFQVTTVPVAGFDNAEIDFSWSTNGQDFLYANFNNLYKINKDGSGHQLIYSTPDGSFISEVDWSYDSSKIAIKTNDANGYSVKIYIIDMLGNTIKTILQGVTGAAGGLNFSVDGDQLLYTHDVSGHQEPSYRQLDTHIFSYNLLTDVVTDWSVASSKPNGTNDLDPRFSPNNAEIIFMNTSNDNISPRNIEKITMQTSDRTALFPDAEMPDWE